VISPPLDIATLRAGIARVTHRQHSAFIPPAEIMLAFYACHPGFSVGRHSRVDTDLQLDEREVLGRSDQTLVEALRTSPSGVLHRTAFRDLCIAHGMTALNFRVSTRRSVVLEPLAKDSWCLRGSRAGRTAVPALPNARSLPVTLSLGRRKPQLQNASKDPLGFLSLPEREEFRR